MISHNNIIKNSMIKTSMYVVALLGTRSMSKISRQHDSKCRKTKVYKQSGFAIKKSYLRKSMKIEG